MSKVLIDRELLAGLVSNNRETRLDAERRMYGVLANQPAEAEGVEVVCITQGGCNVTWTATKELSPAGTALMSVRQHQRILSAVTAERDRLGFALQRTEQARAGWEENAELLEKQRDAAEKAADTYRAERDQLRAEVEALRKALEQFADDENWCYDTCNISRSVAKDALVAKDETP